MRNENFDFNQSIEESKAFQEATEDLEPSSSKRLEVFDKSIINLLSRNDSLATRYYIPYPRNQNILLTLAICTLGLGVIVILGHILKPNIFATSHLFPFIRHIRHTEHADPEEGVTIQTSWRRVRCRM